MTKKPMRCVLERSLSRTAAAISWSDPSALDIAGSSAAETDIPKRLTGKRDRVCAVLKAANEPVERKLARKASTNPLICTTPRLTNTGAKFRITVETFSLAMLNDNGREGN